MVLTFAKDPLQSDANVRTGTLAAPAPASPRRQRCGWQAAAGRRREPRLELIAGSVNDSDGSPMALIDNEWSRNILEHGDYAVHAAPVSLE